MSLIKERSIVLRSIRYGDADLILHCLSAKGAKLNVIAKSALKSQKRFGGGILEPSHYLEILVKMPSRSSVHHDALAVLQEAKLIDSFDGIREEYQRLQTALHMLQLIDKVSQEGTDDRELFDLLGNGLRAAAHTRDPALLKLHFEIKVLSHQGILPNWPGIDNFGKASVLEHQSLELSEEQARQLKDACHDLLGDYLNLESSGN